MPDFVTSDRANAAGTVTLMVQHNRSGVIWVVSQISVNTSTVRVGGTCVVTRNGQSMTDTSRVPATAGGLPFYRLNASDKLELRFSGFVSGDTLYGIVSYEESLWGQPNMGWVI